MALGPCTWAFLTQSNDGNLVLAAQNDSNTGNQGWQVGSDRSGQAVIGLEIEASSQNLRKAITTAVPTGPFTVVYTYDGSGAAAGLNVYVNGVLGAVASSANMVGASAAATTSLYLGRKNYASAGSYNGTIFVSLMASRVWTPAEVALFHRDPYQAFLHAPSRVFSFGGLVSVQAQGVGGLVLDGAGGASIPSVGGFSLDGAAAGMVVVPASGVGGVVIDGTGSLRDVGSVGDFDDLPCDCSTEIPLRFPVTSGGTWVGDFDDIDCGCPHLTGAVAMKGQVVRVTFTQEPKHVTAAAPDDALNPANYSIAVVGGTATAPVVVAVDPAIVTGPARGVGNGGATAERGVDVYLDRAAVLGVTYEVTVSAAVVPAAGGTFGPLVADFTGMATLDVVRQVASAVRGMVEWRNDPARGSWVVDDSGDVALDDPLSNLRKRIFRRLMTPKGAFAWLKAYGVGVRLKEVVGPRQLADYRKDAQAQIAQEPEVASVTSTATLVASSVGGLVTFTFKALLRTGGTLDSGFRQQPDGKVVIT